MVPLRSGKRDRFGAEASGGTTPTPPVVESTPAFLIKQTLNSITKLRHSKADT